MWCFLARRKMIWALETGLDSVESVRLLAHLEGCPRCAGFRDRLQNLQAQLAGRPRATAPGDLWPRIEESLFGLNQEASSQTTRPEGFPFRKPFHWAAIASAATLLIVAAVLTFYPFNFFSPRVESAELDLSGYIAAGSPAIENCWLRPAEGFQPVALDALHPNRSLQLFHPQRIAGDYTLRALNRRQIGTHEAAQLTYSNGVDSLSIFEVASTVPLNLGTKDASDYELRSMHCRKMRTASCVLTFVVRGTQFVICAHNHDARFLERVVADFTERYSE